LVGLGVLMAAASPAEAQTIDMARYQRAAIRAVNREDAAEVLNNAMKGKKPEEARASGQRLAQLGAGRLKGEDLKRRAELILDFTEKAGTKICAGWSRGTVTPEQTTQMVAKLDSTAFDEWVRLSVRSMVAEIKDKPKAFEGSQKDVAKMFESMDQGMSSGDSQRFHDIMGRFDKSNNEEACWFGRQLYKSSLALDSKRRDHALRTLIWLETKPS
jgi:uncharacterized protein YoaH (UPF0181 family)